MHIWRVYSDRRSIAPRALSALAIFWLLTGWACAASPVQPETAGPQVLLLTIDGPLTPSMNEYFVRGLGKAAEFDSQNTLVILQLNTPGGSIDVMNSMVQEMRASLVPVVVYVAPRGAMAGSAGAVITMAGQASSMAPETSIGAASPVGGGGEDLGSTMEAKTKNILKATVRSLTEKRGAQAAALAEQMIETAEAVSAQEALEAGLVDFISVDLNELLRQLDGFEVETGAGKLVLHTQGANVNPLDPSLIEQLLSFLTNPNVLVLLLNIGAAAILIEIYSPGGWVAGFIGVVSLAMAAYGLGLLPVNWFGLVFLIIAFVLFILDIKAPTHGALTVAGIGSMITGMLVLFNSPKMPAFQTVSIPLVVISSLFTGGIFLGILIFAVRAQKAPLRMVVDTLVGRTATVTIPLAPSGQVRVGGEMWSADLVEGEGRRVERGERVQIVAVAGLRLKVRPLDE